MGWRFRKSFCPLPGVRLNFSPRGISASVGAGPVRFYAGSQGAAVTTRIPGTGIAYRQSLKLPHSLAAPMPQAIPNAPQPEFGTPQAEELNEIRSASTTTLTSEGLEAVKELLIKAQDERSRLIPELREAQSEAARLKNRHQRWASGWLLRRLFRNYFARLGELATDATDKQSELEEQERLSRLATEFDLPETLKDSFGHLCDAVEALSHSQKIWDTISFIATDRNRERTMALQSIERRPVQISLGSSDLIDSSCRVPRLTNANGGELFFYPAFVLYFVSQQAFALIDIREVRLEFSPLSFIEEQTVPSDAELIGHTWKKANKDGSPDRRFANNYQIPVLRYGDVRLTSKKGLNEAYMISNSVLAKGFADAFAKFQNALPHLTA